MIKFNKKKSFLFVELLLILSIVLFIFAFPILLFSFGFIKQGLITLGVFYFINLLTLPFIFLNKRNDIQLKLTWTLALVLIPGAEAFLYLVINRVPPRKRKIIKKSEEIKESKSIEDIKNSKIDIFFNGDKKLEKLIEEIRKAKKTINIFYFILNNGIFLDVVFSELKKKSKEGVKVRIIVDDFGTFNLSRKSRKKMLDYGIEFKIFNKLNLLVPNGFMNYRVHNKFFIIDEKVAFFGGINIGDDYLSLYSKYGIWHDIHYFGVGEIVKFLNDNFISFWYLVTKQNIRKEFALDNSKNEIDKGYKTLYGISDSPYIDKGNNLFYKYLVEKISGAKKTIKICTPYIVISTEMKKMIKEAIDRGIDFQIITTGRADKKSSFFMTRFDIEVLNDYGVKIYKTNNTFFHSKAFIFDDEEVIFGSTNFDKRSIFLHYETNFLTDDQSLVNKFVNYFSEMIDRSTIQTNLSSDWQWGKKIIYYFTRLWESFF